METNRESHHMTSPLINMGQGSSEFEGVNLMCRICHQMEGALVSPCKCTSFVHKKCIENWLTISNLTQCEVCLEPFQIVRVVPSFYQYIRHGMSYNKSRLLVVDLIWFFFSLYLLILVTTNFYLTECDWSTLGCRISGVEAAINGIILAAFTSWCFYSSRYYRIRFRIWRRKSTHVTLVLPLASQNLGDLKRQSEWEMEEPEVQVSDQSHLLVSRQLTP